MAGAISGPWRPCAIRSETWNNISIIEIGSVRYFGIAYIWWSFKIEWIKVKVTKVPLLAHWIILQGTLTLGTLGCPILYQAYAKPGALDGSSVCKRLKYEVSTGKTTVSRTGSESVSSVRTMIRSRRYGTYLKSKTWFEACKEKLEHPSRGASWSNLLSTKKYCNLNIILVDKC